MYNSNTSFKPFKLHKVTTINRDYELLCRRVFAQPVFRNLIPISVFFGLTQVSSFDSHERSCKKLRFSDYASIKSANYKTSSSYVYAPKSS